MYESQFELRLGDPQATEALGGGLARAFMEAGQGSAVIYLHGELGAGKTTCVRGLLRTLGVSGVIRSPTYTLVETYQLPGITCVHVDLYRLQGQAEVYELGLGDYFDSECLLLVEWPEKGVAALPRADLELTLSYHGASRCCRLSARTVGGQGLLDKLVKDNRLASYVSNLT